METQRSCCECRIHSNHSHPIILKPLRDEQRHDGSFRTKISKVTRLALIRGLTRENIWMSFANSAGHKTSRREGGGRGVIPSLFVFYYFSGFNWGRVILIASLPVIFPSWLGARHPPSMRSCSPTVRDISIPRISVLFRELLLSSRFNFLPEKVLASSPSPPRSKLDLR